MYYNYETSGYLTRVESRLSYRSNQLCFIETTFIQANQHDHIAST